MKTKIEVVIGDGSKQPKMLKQADGRWAVIGESAQCVGYGRGVWVRTFLPDGIDPVDGKGFLVGPTRRLKKG